MATRRRGRPPTPPPRSSGRGARPGTLTPPEALLNGEAIAVFTKAVGGRDQPPRCFPVASTSPDVRDLLLTRYL